MCREKLVEVPNSTCQIVPEVSQEGTGIRWMDTKKDVMQNHTIPAQVFTQKNNI
jgi:hypothetical protein